VLKGRLKERGNFDDTGEAILRVGYHTPGPTTTRCRMIRDTVPKKETKTEHNVSEE
jgi:hypothetical protein